MARVAAKKGRTSKAALSEMIASLSPAQAESADSSEHEDMPEDSSLPAPTEHEDTAMSTVNTEKEAAPRDDTARPEQTERHAGGRPRTAQDRVQFTLRPLAKTRLMIKRFALDHDITSSDVLDAIAPHIEEIWAQLKDGGTNE